MHGPIRILRRTRETRPRKEGRIQSQMQGSGRSTEIIQNISSEYVRRGGHDYFFFDAQANISNAGFGFSGLFPTTFFFGFKDAGTVGILLETGSGIVFSARVVDMSADKVFGPEREECMSEDER